MIIKCLKSIILDSKKFKTKRSSADLHEKSKVNTVEFYGPPLLVLMEGGVCVDSDDCVILHHRAAHIGELRPLTAERKLQAPNKIHLLLSNSFKIQFPKSWNDQLNRAKVKLK